MEEGLCAVGPRLWGEEEKVWERDVRGLICCSSAVSGRVLRVFRTTCSTRQPYEGATPICISEVRRLGARCNLRTITQLWRGQLDVEHECSWIHHHNNPPSPKALHARPSGGHGNPTLHMQHDAPPLEPLCPWSSPCPELWSSLFSPASVSPSLNIRPSHTIPKPSEHASLPLFMSSLCLEFPSSLLPVLTTPPQPYIPVAWQPSAVKRENEVYHIFKSLFEHALIWIQTWFGMLHLQETGRDFCTEKVEAKWGNY